MHRSLLVKRHYISCLTTVALAGLALAISACGGAAEDNPATPSGGGGGGAIAGGGTSANPSAYTGGRTTTLTGTLAPSGGTTSACAALNQPSCISSCEEQSPTWSEAICASGHWQCPAGTVDLAGCASSSCAASHVLCCNVTSGTFAIAPCGADGLIENCPKGTRVMTNDCVPDDVGATDCMQLDGQACSARGTECHMGNVFCTCGGDFAASSSTPKWFCVVYLY
jgi:hypothetical protein